MIYIRTKDGIVDEMQTVRTSSIVEKSSKLGKLLDYIVFRNKGKMKSMYDSWRDAVCCEGEKLKEYDEIIGAIETDKGIIYVAKMNKEGRMELCRF